MGLLTDPGAGQGKLTLLLVKNHAIFCTLLYLGGVLWFIILAHEPLNNGTYFSENALLPGLVQNEYNEEKTSKVYYEELLDEQKKYQSSIPYPWILAKFRQIGLDTYTHNFTLNYPLGRGQVFTGKNVYGIVRAPRAASTEALVLTVPYRGPNSVHSATAPSVALMLSFAGFCKRQKYWAKDIIFLITEHEQLGIQAWLEAYHGVGNKNEGNSDVLQSGNLIGRAGAIQAAIALELHSTQIGYIDVKIEGLNGQLPNLDLVNLAYKLSSKEGIPHTFKQRYSWPVKVPGFKEWIYSLETLMAMITTQATGVPTGNHGLFHRFGIEAITLEGFPKTSNRYSSLHSCGRLLELIFRSLNNLLERFHQSYFFYLLPSSERFISIGSYMGTLCAFSAALLIKAFALWLKIQDKPLSKLKKKMDSKKNVLHKEIHQEKTIVKQIENKDDKETFDNKDKISGENTSAEIGSEVSTKDVEIVRLGLIFLVAHTAGIIVMNSPKFLTQYGLDYYGFSTELSIYYGCAALAIKMLPIGFILHVNKYASAITLNIIGLLEMATLLTAVGMHNFSLAFLTGVIYIPVVLWISPKTKWSVKSTFQPIIWLLLHPFVVLTVIVIIYTYFMFPNEPTYSMLSRGLSAAQQAFVFSIVDSMVYGNWLFNVITAIFVPNWLCFWCMLVSKTNEINENKVKED